VNLDFSIGRIAALFKITTVKGALIASDNPGQEGCFIKGDLTKLLTDLDTLLLLISCQNPAHKFGSYKMHAQFKSQNLLACPITNSHLISKVFNGSASILMNELLKFGHRVVHCAVDGPTSVLIILNGCLTGPEPSMPFKHPCTAHAFFPEHLSNH
jgi:hypothetical protein